MALAAGDNLRHGPGRLDHTAHHAARARRYFACAQHVPALMSAIARKRSGARLVFAIRGFMPEEYTDAGVWPANGYLYRGLKRVERYLLRVSDAFVVLTEKARDIVFPGCTHTENLGRAIEVIPC